MASHYQFVERAAKDGTVQRLAVSSLASLYSCCGLFDMCGDADLMSLSMAGVDRFLDVLGWTATDVCKIEKNFISYVRPTSTLQGGRTPGYLADPCADPASAEFGTCGFRLEDFARLRRASPTRDITKAGLRMCDIQPRYRWDGSTITDDMEFGMRLATEALLQDLRNMIITGNAGTPGQFSGLEQLIATGYHDPAGVRCQAMDSTVINWNHNGMDGGAGITWNGAAVADTFNIVDVLLAIFSRIRQRLSWAPPLAGAIGTGDIVLVLPTNLIRCILDAFTCWSVCPNGFSEEWANGGANISGINSLEARRYRETLNGGMFGNGRIWLDGFEIPLLAYDWSTMHGVNSGDMYFLTLRSGNVRLIEGQYNNMAPVPGYVPGSEFRVTDGGRFLTWAEEDHTCVRQIIEFQPRLLMWAPWAQARIQDVRCAGVVGPISPDPWATSYFPEGSVDPAECPTPE